MNKKGSKIGVIGTGNVGATIAYTLTISGIVAEIALMDANYERAAGEAMDIIQGTSFCPPVNVYSGGYEALADSDIVIVTAGIGRKPGQSRIDLVQTNIGIYKDIFPKVVSYAPNAIYVIVSNPVDILTYIAIKYSGLPKNQIIGSGTMLDSTRLRTSLAMHIGINPHDVEAYVLGEHGSTAMIPWSLTSIAGMKMSEYCKHICDQHDHCGKTDLNFIVNDVMTAGEEVIKRKGATYYAVALAVSRICEAIIRDAKSVLTVSNLIYNRYGINDVCLSLPVVIGAGGIIKELPVTLTESEEQKLRQSADALKSILNSVDI